MAFIRVEPVQVQVRTDWFSGRPRAITWGDEQSPDHPARGRPRGSRRLSGHQRAADALRSGHAQGASLVDVPAPVAPVDRHGSRRSRSDARRLTRRTIASASRGLGSPARRPDWRGRLPAPPVTSSGFGAGAPVPRPPRLRRPIHEPSPAAAHAALVATVSQRACPYNRCVETLCGRSLRRPDPHGFIEELGSAAPVPGRWQRLGRGRRSRRQPRGDGRRPVRGSPEVRPARRPAGVGEGIGPPAGGPVPRARGRGCRPPTPALPPR